MNKIRKIIILSALVTAMNLPSVGTAGKPSSSDGCYVYMAAGLFSTSQTNFNKQLTTYIQKGLPGQFKHNTFLPQRDGFEFSNLQAELAKVLPAAQVVPATHIIIYYLDIGYFIPKSHVVSALVDEPLDPGVVVEITHARLMGEPVIEYKTDSLSPFGEFGDPLGGIHFFPPFNSNVFILARGQTLNTLSNKLNFFIDDAINAQFSTIPNYDCSKNAWDYINSDVKNNPVIADLMKGADILFDNVAVDRQGKLLPSGSMNNPAYYAAFLKAIHTSDGLKRVANNYKNAVAADPSHPELIFKSYPVISNESEVLPPL